jgi:glutaredoxin-like YruB-family protein
VRALLFVVLIGLIGAGALYILSRGQQDDSKLSSVASTLTEMTSRVLSPADEGGAMEASGGRGESDLGLGRWFGDGDPEVSRSSKDVYYQYVDGSGTVHFVQDLGEVPAEWQHKAGRIEVERAAPTPGRGGSRAAADRRTTAKRPAEKPVAYRTGPEVVVYTTAWCGWCRKTLEFLDERGVRYVNKDIEANDRNRDELIQKTGRTSIPVVEIDGEIIRGYDAARMERLLAGAG